MRVIEINNDQHNVYGTVKIPDRVAYVYNPNYVEINLTGNNDYFYLSISDSIEEYKISVTLYYGLGKSYISKIMQYFFKDYISTRSKELSIILEDKNRNEIMSESIVALWASVEPGKKFGYYLPFVYNEVSNQKYVREVIWFKNFPFRVSMFRETDGYNMYAKSDSGIPVAIYSGTEVSWTNQTEQQNVNLPRRRKSPNLGNGTVAANIIQAPASQVLDLGLLYEAGLEVDLEATGIYDVSQLSQVPLGDVVIRRRGNVREWSWLGDDNMWDDFSDSGLDIITFFTIYGGKTGILDFSPKAMFPNTTKQLVYTIMRNTPQGADFDANFDIVFNEITSLAYIVKLIVCEDMEGIYLRWIDNYGFWQYFLFKDGSITDKNKLSSTTINAEYENYGKYHASTRCIHVDNEETIKCCATNLGKETLAYVKTIYKSPHIEMFIGYDIEQNEMWMPVSIVGGTSKIEANQKLYDYEVSIKLPDTASQTI